MPERVNRPEPWEATPGAEPKREGELVEGLPPSVQHVGDSVTTGTIPISEVEPVPAPRTRPVRSPMGLWLGVLAIGCVVAGVLAGVLWEAIVPLPTYLVNVDGYAATSERGLADFVAGDAWFVVLGVVLGGVCGLISWWWFGGLGWRVVPLAVGGSLLMAALCWLVGWLLGPGPFEPRLAAASPGEVLAIELTVRGPVALLVWPFAACLVVMLLSALTRDPEEHT